MSNDTKSCTVGDVYRVLDAFAPFDTAEEWDNPGLLVGKMDRPVDTILTALDATPGVVREAKAVGAQLIVTHHPLMFDPLRNLNEENPEAATICDMVRADISMIAAHTNLDLATGGVNDALAEKLGWPVSQVDGYLRLGDLPQPRTLSQLALETWEALGSTIVKYGSTSKEIRRFAICSGAGGSEVAKAAELGAEVFLTGEIKHHEALFAMAYGMTVLACGHRPTEICGAEVLARHLQSALNEVESRVRVIESVFDPFA